MGVLYARVAGAWVPVSTGGGASEVEIGTADPIGTNANAELWVDTDEPNVMTDDMRWNTAWGVVAAGSFTVADGASVPTQTVVASVTGTLVAGRRYRLCMFANAIGTATGMHFVTIVDGAVDSRAVWLYNAGNYGAFFFQRPIVTGDAYHSAGNHTIQIRYDGTPNIVFYNNAGYVTLEDVGPVSTAVPMVNPIPPWQALPLINNWTNYGGGYSTAAYRKVGDEVQVRGLVKQSPAGLTAIAFLPIEYRPPGYLLVPTASNDLFGQIRVDPDGQIVLNVGSPVWVSLNPIRFSVSP